MKSTPLIAVFGLALASAAYSQAPSYPEYNGNYIKCDSGWCEVNTHALNLIQMWQPLEPYSGKPGSNAVVYPCFYEVPTTYRTRSVRPNFLIFPTQVTTDPSTIILVEFGKMPFTNWRVMEADGRKVPPDGTYSPSNLKGGKPIWVFKREVELRYRPVTGKQGMFILEPREALSPGLYGIDLGKRSNDGQSGLNAIPTVMGFWMRPGSQMVIPFVVGDPEEVAGQSVMSRLPDISFGGRRSKPLSDSFTK